MNFPQMFHQLSHNHVSDPCGCEPTVKRLMTDNGNLSDSAHLFPLIYSFCLLCLISLLGGEITSKVYPQGGAHGRHRKWRHLGAEVMTVDPAAASRHQTNACTCRQTHRTCCSASSVNIHLSSRSLSLSLDILTGTEGACIVTCCLSFHAHTHTQSRHWVPPSEESAKRVEVYGGSSV